MLVKEIWVHKNIFQNKRLIKALLKCPTFSLYPSNTDIFIDLHIKNVQATKLPLINVTTMTEHSTQRALFQIALETGARLCTHMPLLPEYD